MQFFEHMFTVFAFVGLRSSDGMDSRTATAARA